MSSTLWGLTLAWPPSRSLSCWSQPLRLSCLLIFLLHQCLAPGLFRACSEYVVTFFRGHAIRHKELNNGRNCHCWALAAWQVLLWTLHQLIIEYKQQLFEVRSIFIITPVLYLGDESRRGSITCLRSHSHKVAESGFKHRESDSKTHECTDRTLLERRGSWFLLPVFPPPHLGPTYLTCGSWGGGEDLWGKWRRTPHARPCSPSVNGSSERCCEASLSDRAQAGKSFSWQWKNLANGIV